jgi:hypothetical protein
MMWEGREGTERALKVKDRFDPKGPPNKNTERIDETY